MKRYRRFNIIVTVAIFVGFTLLGIFVFRISYCRSYEALIDLYGSFKYYFCNLFGIETSGLPNVILPSKVLDNTTNLPSDLGGFTQRTKDYSYWFFNGENFKLWGAVTAERFTEFLKVITILFPCFILVIVVIKRIYGTVNNNYNVDTKPLKAYKWLTEKTVLPLKKLILDYIVFLRQNRWIWITWLIIWIFHLNLATIVIEFFAYYFFFAISFQLGTIYPQFVKLAVDLHVLFKHVPLWVLLIIGIVLLDRWRRKTAKNRLRHFEARNCGFINELPIVSMSCGSMGKKKTTLITDMALSQEVMFRQKALEILQNADMKFPYFPWICFEEQIQTAMEHGQIYNLASVKIFVHKKCDRYLKNADNTEQIYGYDIARYGREFCDALSVKTLFDILETYALAYFVYVIESSLIVSNFSIRTDNFVTSEGNFPLWVTDFFSNGQRRSRHSHILDFDVLRLGKKVLENNPKAGSFEFGVVAITEIGKERGTMDGKSENKRYFLMNYKIYRNRFTTDCFSVYFNDLASRASVGLMDYIEYATEKASVEELKAQNSYFVNGLYRDEEGA